MQLFYIPDVNKEMASMSPEESHHCIKVLRMTKGADISFVDGRGGMYQGEIVVADHKNCKVSISNYMPEYESRYYRLHIAIAPTKNLERLEWFAEKAVEIGVDEITPIICFHSERKKIREDRLLKIMISAMKQSVKAKLPELHPLINFKEFVENDFNADKFIAHCQEDNKEELLLIPARGDNSLVLIGPEGDFDDSEIKTAIENGFIPVNLGSSRLRTETAGVAAAQIMADKHMFYGIP